jgi:hypothetical protein
MDATKIQKIWSIGNALAGTNSLPADGPVNGHAQKLPAAEHITDYIQQTELKDIEQIILRHESVENVAVVLSHDEDDQDDAIVAFVSLRTPGVETSSHRLPENDEEKQRVQFWDGYWDVCTYPAMDELELNAVGRDFLGWTSMYDGKEINKTDMNEWLDETIEIIRSICPKPMQILEVGTGSGMILFNLINDMDSYVGIEMSPTAVKFVTGRARSIPELANKIHMYQGTAADLKSLNIPNTPNLVVVNSVAQYFPSQDYLLDVIETVLQLPTVRTLFFGDIRSLALYDEFLISKSLHDAGGKATIQDLQIQMEVLAERELELLIDPAFFTALPDRFPGIIEHVEIYPKKMQAVNELSCYRFGAVIHIKDRSPRLVGRHVREVGDNAWIDFVRQGLNREELLRLLSSSSGVVAISNIRNSKLILESSLIDLLRENPQNGHCNQDDWLSNIRIQAQHCSALSTADLVELAQQTSRKVELSWARQHSQRGGFDAIFHQAQADSCDGESGVMFRFPTDHEGRDFNALTNQPLELQAKQALRDQLNENLQSELPVHLLPKQINFVERMPMKANGEVDRDVLKGQL